MGSIQKLTSTKRFFPEAPKPYGATRRIIPLRRMPRMPLYASELVRAFDQIRSERNDPDDEFGWFAREFPRCYRYYLLCADFRLQSIRKGYSLAHRRLRKQLRTSKNGLWSAGYSNISVYQIYWDFDSFLSSVSSALDLLARIVGTAYREQLPASFNRLCGRAPRTGPAELLRKAQDVWVSRMKDYRDCLVHYAPVDTLCLVTFHPYRDGWDVRARLPINPRSRNLLAFRFGRRADVHRYAITIARHMLALDAAVAREILRQYRQGKFPLRTEHLFFLGAG